MSGEDARSCLWRWSDVRLIRTARAAADQLVGSLVSPLSSSRHESVTPLGEVPAPDENPRDPRAARKRLHFAGEHAHPEIRSSTGYPAALTELARQAVGPATSGIPWPEHSNNDPGIRSLPPTPEVAL